MRTKAIINLEKLVENYKTILSLQPDGCKLMVVLKANAYGHGSVECAKMLEKVGATFFAVACLSEALELRRNGIKGDILIFGWTPIEDIQIVVENNLIQTLIDVDYYKRITNYVEKIGIELRAHIKLDSGMSRMGWICYGSKYKKSMNELLEIYNDSNLNIEGIYTHFSSLYEQDEESCKFSNLQYNRFKSFIEDLRTNNIDLGLCHCNNSAGTLNNPEYGMNMSRLGTALFGILPEKIIKTKLKLEPVMNWKASVSMVKEVDENTPISYSRTAYTKRITRLAAVTVGYADGYARSLSNIGIVGIRGNMCPVIGRICMDMMMVDITDYKEIVPGDEVMLLGKDKYNEIACELLWKEILTGPSDITCSITSRVPREYI